MSDTMPCTRSRLISTTTFQSHLGFLFPTSEDLSQFLYIYNIVTVPPRRRAVLIWHQRPCKSAPTQQETAGCAGNSTPAYRYSRCNGILRHSGITPSTYLHERSNYRQQQAHNLAEQTRRVQATKRAILPHYIPNSEHQMTCHSVPQTNGSIVQHLLLRYAPLEHVAIHLPRSHECHPPSTVEHVVLPGNHTSQ